jgi:hypothetical protein
MLKSQMWLQSGSTHSFIIGSQDINHSSLSQLGMANLTQWCQCTIIINHKLLMTIAYNSILMAYWLLQGCWSTSTVTNTVVLSETAKFIIRNFTIISKLSVMWDSCKLLANVHHSAKTHYKERQKIRPTCHHYTLLVQKKEQRYPGNWTRIFEETGHMY